MQIYQQQEEERLVSMRINASWGQADARLKRVVHVFLSYASADRDRALRNGDLLEAQGV